MYDLINIGDVFASVRQCVIACYAHDSSVSADIRSHQLMNTAVRQYLVHHDCVVMTFGTLRHWLRI